MIKIDRLFFTSEVYQILFEKSIVQTFSANEVVVELGSVCHHLLLVEKGLLRSFYYDLKGNDITHWFASEDMIITVPPSFFNREPSTFGIEAIERTVTRAITYQQLEAAFQASTQLERFGRLLTTEIMIALGRKIIDLQTKSAEERYDELLLSHPEICMRAKLGHIAGYLGIKPQSLSRIRASKRSNDKVF